MSMEDLKSDLARERERVELAGWERILGDECSRAAIMRFVEALGFYEARSGALEEGKRAAAVLLYGFLEGRFPYLFGKMVSERSALLVHEDAMQRKLAAELSEKGGNAPRIDDVVQ